MTPYGSSGATTFRATTITQQEKKSFYFSRNNQNELKEKHEFRERFDSQESKQRCMDIWHEFSEDKTLGKVEGLRANLFVKIISLADNFATLGLKVTFQLFYQPAKAHSNQT